MRWGDLDFRFVRPLRWLVALYDEEVIDFTVANVTSGRVSRGHRFSSEKPDRSPQAGIPTVSQPRPRRCRSADSAFERLQDRQSDAAFAHS